jgi:hypothetical protein
MNLPQVSLMLLPFVLLPVRSALQVSYNQPWLHLPVLSQWLTNAASAASFAVFAWKQNFYGSRAARWLTVAAIVVSVLPLPRIPLIKMSGIGALLYSSINFVVLLAFAGGLACAYRACRQGAEAQQALPITISAG